MSIRWWTSGVWALVAGSLLYWGLKVFVAPDGAPAHTRMAEAAPPLHGDLTRLLGAEAPPPALAAEEAPPADSRFRLVGVVSPRAPQAASEGVALIAVDGNAPKAYRIGAVVDGTTVLKSVAARGATLGPRDGSAAMTLALAPPAPPATGVLPTASSDSGASMRAPMLRAPMRQMPTQNYSPSRPATVETDSEGDGEVQPATLPQSGLSTQ